MAEFGLVAVLMAVAIVVATALYMLGGNRSGMSADSIAAGMAKENITGAVLVGRSGSGKTSVLHRLCSGAAPKTVPSMVPAYHSAELPSAKQIQVVDTPGHERMESSVMQHVKDAKGVVLVVDSTSSRAIKLSARILFTMLSWEALSLSTPMLVRDVAVLSTLSVMLPSCMMLLEVAVGGWVEDLAVLILETNSLAQSRCVCAACARTDFLQQE